MKNQNEMQLKLNITPETRWAKIIRMISDSEKKKAYPVPEIPKIKDVLKAVGYL